MEEVKNNLKLFIILLLVVTFLKNVVWSVITPIWAGPDEPAHFGYSQYIYKTKSLPDLYKPFISKAIVNSTKLLEIEKINFHSNIIFSFSNEQYSKEEKTIRNFNKNYFNEFIIWASLGINPPIYYILPAIFSLYFSNFDLFIQVYSVRFVSIIFSLGTVFLSYKIAKMIFKKDPIITIAIPTLVSFQPMMTFVSGVINNDNLLIFLFTLFFYLTSLIFYSFRLSVKYTLFISITIALALLTKQQSFILMPITLLTYYICAKRLKSFKKFLYHATILILFVSIISGWYYWKLFSQNALLVPLDSPEKSRLSSSFMFDITNMIPHFFSISSFKTLFNYYWGTFGWLDARFPSYIYGLFLGITSVSFFGILVKVYKKRGHLKDFMKNDVFVILALSIISLLVVIVGYNFESLQITGKPWMQGRYLLPVIVPTTIFLLMGIKELFKIKIAAIATIAIMISSNLYALFFTLIPRYYGLNPNLWIQRISQNKPEFLKGDLLLFLISLYLVFTLFYSIFLIFWVATAKLEDSERKNRFKSRNSR